MVRIWKILGIELDYEKTECLSPWGMSYPRPTPVLVAFVVRLVSGLVYCVLVRGRCGVRGVR